MEINKIHWKICGAAGKGAKSSGLIFAKTCTRGGLNAFGYTEYPSLVKGGHNTYQVRVEEDEVTCTIKNINMLVALDKQTILQHEEELTEDGVIIYDEERVIIKKEELKKKNLKLINIPAKKITEEQNLGVMMESPVFLGASFALLDYDFELLKGVIADTYKSKGQKIVDDDVKAAKAGYDYVIESGEDKTFPFKLVAKKNPEKKMFLTGNDAISLGAIHSGLKFYAAYPMTPATSILHTLAGLAEKYNFVVKHAEDEISVINMTIGAGYAGTRAMCGTSSGGFALMQEGISLAGMTETPIVVVESMRGGPATGIPTWTEQGDLKFVLNAGHSEFPRYVLAPGDAKEAYYMTGEALNIAEKYQTPVIILIDKHISESNWTFPFFKEKIKIDRGKWTTDKELEELKKKGIRYKRYNFETETGISPRVRPGQHKNGIFTANSDEHNEYGYSEEGIKNRNEIFAKRMQKIETYKKEMPKPKLYGDKKADITMVCWGSGKTMTLQTLKWLQEEGIKANCLHLTHLSPFPAEEVREILGKQKNILNIEHNYTAQMAEVIRANTSIEITNHCLKNDGRPILPEEILIRAKEVLRGE